ncbi:prepilin-type N-terminal cleavage/methylation domain-containing protein [Candidatus Omnitrophota bacterium]
MKRKKRSFILFEILVALAILAFGLSYIFRILFGSMSTLQHLHNRLDAQLMIENKIWEAKQLVKTKEIDEEYVDKAYEGESPQIKVLLKLNKLSGFKNLYSAEIVASWSEETRNISVNRFLYICKL